MDSHFNIGIMLKFANHFLVILIIILFFNELSAGCLDKETSFAENISKAREFLNDGNLKKAASFYKKHLLCWQDSEITIELAKMFESEEKYYLAGLVYKEAGMLDEYKKTERLRIEKIKKTGNSFLWESAKRESVGNKKAYNRKKTFGIIFMILGTAAAGTGLGFLINDPQSNEFDHLMAQYYLLIGGLSLIEGGLFLDYSADNSLNVSRAYSTISREHKDVGTTALEYYEYSGAAETVKRNSAKTLRAHGIAMILFSIPMFAVSIYSFFDTYRFRVENSHIESSEDCDSWCYTESDWKFGTGMIHTLLIATLAPAIISLTGGIIMISRSSDWKHVKSHETIFVLNNIAPVIDPVSKTYGLSMGFSF